MSRNLERLLQKANAQRPQPAMLPGNALPIIGQTSAHMPERIDGLIAAGLLAAVDRPRCVFWLDFVNRGEPLSPDQLALVRTQVMAANAQVPDVAAAFVVTMGPLLECLNPPDAKSAIGDSLLECTPKMRHKNKGQFSRGERCPRGSAVSSAGSSSSRR